MDNNQDSEDKENPPPPPSAPPDPVPTIPVPALDDEELNQKQEELNKKLLSACNYWKNKVDLEEVKRLLRAGADVNTTDSNGWTCLMDTARKGRYEASKLLIEEKADINMKSNHNSTALNLASQYGYKEIIQMLLENGARHDIKDNDGDSPLFFASTRGYTEIENLLLEYGASPLDDDELKKKHELLNKDLVFAIRVNHLEEVQRLLRAGADINTKLYDTGDTCLMYTAWQGRYETSKLLIQEKADINMKSNSGNTALHHASGRGHTELVQMLLEKGAIPDIKDNDGDSPLFLASINGYTEIENLLLEYGAFLDDDELRKKEEKHNKELLSVCAYDDEVDLEEVQRLLRAGANINTRDSDGRTCLMNTAKKGNIKIVKLLLENGAMPDVKNNDGYSPLFYASYKGHEEIENLLLEHGAPPLDQDELKRKQEKLNNKLHSVCVVKKIEVDLEEVQRLLRAGANPDIKDNHGVSPLIKATENRHPEVVKLLLESGADPYINNTYGDTALSIAQDKKFQDIEDILVPSILAWEIMNRIKEGQNLDEVKVIKIKLEDQDFEFIAYFLNFYVSLPGMESPSRILPLFLDKDLTLIDNLFIFIKAYKNDENKKEYRVTIQKVFNNEKPFYLMETEKLSENEKKVSLLDYLINKGCVQRYGY